MVFAKRDCLYYLVLAFVWTATVLYCDVHDYECFFSDYCRLAQSSNAIVSKNYEPGFYWSMRVFVACRMPFSVYYGVFMSVVLGLFCRFIRRSAYRRNYVLTLCVCFPYLYYLQQMRSAMAAMIILNGLIGLRDSDGKRNTIGRYIIVCLVASMFHITSLLYLVFLLAVIMSKKSIQRIVVSMNIIVPTILVIFSPMIVKFLNMIFFDFWMIDYYLGKGVKFQKYTWCVTGMYFIFLMVLFYMDAGSGATAYGRGYEVNYKLSVLVCGLSVLAYFSVLFDRIPIMMTPVIYVTLDQYLCQKVRKQKNLIVKLAGIVFAAVYFGLMVGPWNPAMNKRFFTEMWRQKPIASQVGYIGDRE